MASTQSKERIMVGAKELFLARGYADAICEKAELTKGSFYYFFDTKEDLGLAVLDWSLRRSAQMLASGLHAGIEDPVEKAFAFLEHLEKCSSELWSGGCLLGSFSMELGDTNSRVQHRCGRVPGDSGDLAEKLQPDRRSVRRQAGTASQRIRRYAFEHRREFHHTGQSPPRSTRIAKAIRGFRLSLAT
jgi:TetR/AcrR family transcriptional repressor of nem operon